MCLIKDKLKYTGNKRITCYKVLESTLISPYQWFQYILNHRYDTSFGFRAFISKYHNNIINWDKYTSLKKISYSADSFFNTVIAIINHHSKKDYDIITNSFHTFKDIYSAENLRRELNYYSDGREYIIVKCTIPEYTWYYEGSCGFSYSAEHNSYASESIILEEIL